MTYRFTYRPPTTSTLALICAASAAFVGCAKEPADTEADQPKIEITSQGAALTAVENTEIALKGIVESGDFLAESMSLAETLNALNGGSTTGCDAAPAPCDTAELDCVPEEPVECPEDAVTEEDLQQVRDDLNESIDQLVTRLRDEVFIEANLDAAGTNETQVTYRLGASVLCKPVEGGSVIVEASEDPAPVEPVAAEPDPECVENAEKANLRVRLTQPNPDDVDVTFIITDDNYTPLTLQLYNDRLGLKVDLAEGLKAMEALGEDVEEIDSLEGVVQLQLVKKAQLEYALQLSILEDLGLSFHEDDGGNFSYSLAKSEPTVELAINGNTKTISASYNYGAIQLLAPLKSLATLFEDDADTPTTPTLEDPLAPVPEPQPEKTYTGMIELLVAGYTGTFSYTADTDTFSFSNVSLGSKTSTLKHDGNVLASVDLNPEDGRGFDLVIHSDAETNSALVSIDPTIDLNIGLNFAHIADQVENIPETLLGDKLRLWFEGNEPSFAVEDERLRMISGSFHMSSEQSPESNVDVDEGQCLVSASSTVEVTTGEDVPVEEATSLFEVEVTACQ